jgi:hypothetical protein
VLEQRYTEGSTWSAYEVTDFVTIGLASNDNSSSASYEFSIALTIPFTFGCQTSLSGLFQRQHADGILGMEHSDFIITRALVDQGAFDDIKNNQNDGRHRGAFSLCLSAKGGWMGVGGGALVDHHIQPMRATPMVETFKRETDKKSMYTVTVNEFWLGAMCLACSGSPESDALVEAFAIGKGTILDSGTTDTYLPAQLATVFKEAWFNQTGRRLEERVARYSEDEFRKLPEIRIVFANNVTLTVSPLNYMEGAIDAKWTMKVELTNRMYVDEDRGAVLGINSMLDHDILYDWEGGLIGIAPADCS